MQGPSSHLAKPWTWLDLRCPVYMTGVGLEWPTPEVQREGSTQDGGVPAPPPPPVPHYFTFGNRLRNSFPICELGMSDTTTRWQESWRWGL